MDKFLHGDGTREEKFWDQSRISSGEGKRSVGKNKDPFMAFERLYFIFSANSRISKLKTIAPPIYKDEDRCDMNMSTGHPLYI